MSLGMPVAANTTYSMSATLLSNFGQPKKALSCAPRIPFPLRSLRNTEIVRSLSRENSLERRRTHRHPTRVSHIRWALMGVLQIAAVDSRSIRSMSRTGRIRATSLLRRMARSVRRRCAWPWHPIMRNPRHYAMERLLLIPPELDYGRVGFERRAA